MIYLALLLRHTFEFHRCFSRHAASAAPPPPFFCSKHLFLKFTFKKMNNHEVAPPPYTSKMEVIGTHVLPYAPPHGLGFSGFWEVALFFRAQRFFG